MDTVQIVVSALVPLLGVALGASLTELEHRRGWRRERDAQLTAMRREVYSKFMTAARTWQSNVLEPQVRIETSHRGVPYADAGSAYGDTIRALAELRFVAGTDATITAAWAWEQALRDLSSARAETGVTATDDGHLHAVKAAEDDFVTTARNELQATN